MVRLCNVADIFENMNNVRLKYSVAFYCENKVKNVPSLYGKIGAQVKYVVHSIDTVLSDAENSAYAIIKIYRFFHEYYLNLLMIKFSIAGKKQLLTVFWNFQLYIV